MSSLYQKLDKNIHIFFPPKICLKEFLNNNLGPTNTHIYMSWYQLSEGGNSCRPGSFSLILAPQ